LSYNINIDDLKDIIIEANKIAIYNFNKDLKVEKKEDNSPVSNADIEISEFLNKSLIAKYPDIKILCEENVISFNQRKNEEYLWIIDPIDGTKDYISGKYEWTINIALIHKDRPIFSIVSAPYYDEIFYAKENEGAFLIKDNKIEQIQSNTSIDEKTILISNFHHSKRTDEFISHLSKYFKIKQIAMSSSLKMCKIAQGVADIHIKFSQIYEWDICASELILKESGGAMLSLITNKEPIYNKENLKTDPLIVLSKELLNNQNIKNALTLMND